MNFKARNFLQRRPKKPVPQVLGLVFNPTIWSEVAAAVPKAGPVKIMRNRLTGEERCFVTPL